MWIVSLGAFALALLFEARIRLITLEILLGSGILVSLFSWIYALNGDMDKTYTTDDDGKRKEEWHTIFKGLFFHADFNKNFQGRTYVVPEVRGGLKVFSSVGGMAQRGDRVKLEDPEFEKIYEVYGTDQIESRYILTPAIMQAMTAIKKELDTFVYFSFIEERVYCAMYFNKNLFEPRIMKSGVNFEDIEKMYKLFATNALIINELNLNTRIWTKD